MVIEGEDPDEFEAFATGMRRELAPAGDLQDLIADRLIAAAWRLKRIASLELALLTPEKVRAEFMNTAAFDATPFTTRVLDGAEYRGLLKDTGFELAEHSINDTAKGGRIVWIARRK